MLSVVCIFSCFSWILLGREIISKNSGVISCLFERLLWCHAGTPSCFVVYQLEIGYNQLHIESDFQLIHEVAAGCTRMAPQ